MPNLQLLSSISSFKIYVNADFIFKSLYDTYTQPRKETSLRPFCDSERSISTIKIVWNNYMPYKDGHNIEHKQPHG